MKELDSVAIVSGGLDSTTLVYDMLDKGLTPHLLSFNYGQRHRKELTYAQATAKKLGVRIDIVDLTSITYLISNSALTSKSNGQASLRNLENDPFIEVPEGHYAEDTMKATVVPNRNMIMLSIAAGVAVNNKYKSIGIGVHAGDHFVYPDCRPLFVNYVGDAILAGNDGFHNFGHIAGSEFAYPIYAPFIHLSKEDIAYRAIELRVPFEDTWSCYKGGEAHCGKCGTCVERLEAIAGAQQRAMENEIAPTIDGTVYEDTEFWKQQVGATSN